MTSAVYEGLTNSGPGALFQGKAFFIHRKCPAHHALVSKVKENGGRVLPMEKNADIFIYDHARKDAPPGSVSWTFIDDCMQSGQLLDPQDPKYVIRAVNEQRPAGSGLPIKATRTPYTAEDDANLKEFMINYLRYGNTSGGNKVYQEFANQRPRHPWQSWKERWRQALEPHLTRAEKELMNTPLTASLPVRTPNEPNTDIHPPHRPSHPPALPTMSGRDALMSDEPVRGPRERRPFSTADDELIVEYVGDRQYHSEGLTGTKIWRRFAITHPHHTEQSWRNRYLKTILPRLRQLEGDETNSRQVLEHRKQNSSAAPKEARQPLSKSSPNVPPREVDAVTPDTKQELDINDIDGENSSRKQPPQERWKSPDKEQEEVNTTSDIIMIDPDIFRVGFHAYRVNKGLTRTLTPVVCGKMLDSCKFFQTVVQAHVDDPQQRDWVEIAAALGFSDNDHDDAPSKLRECYVRHFEEFESLALNFAQQEQTMLDETDEEEEHEAPNHRRTKPAELDYQDDGGPTSYAKGMDPKGSAHDVEEEIGGQDNDLDLALEAVAQELFGTTSQEIEFASSPPIHPKRKAAVMSSEKSYPGPSQKRVAYSRDSVIPATPTHRYGASTSRYEKVQEVSPTPVSKQPEARDAAFESRIVQPNPLLSEVSGVREPTNRSESFPQTPSKQIISKLAQQSSQSRHSISGSTLKQIENVPSPAQRIIPEATPRALSHPAAKQRSSISSPKNSRMPALRPDPHEVSPRRQPRSPIATSTPKRTKSGLISGSHRTNSLRQSSQPKPPTNGKGGQKTTTRLEPKGIDTNRTEAKPLAANDYSEEFMNRLMALGDYSKSMVREAMKAASYEPSVAQQGLENLGEGKCLPSDIKGLWTSQDDDDLKVAYKIDTDKAADSLEESTRQHEARVLKKVLRKKHGKKAVKLRRKLWDEWGG